MEHYTGLCLLILLRNSICSSLDGDTRNSCVILGNDTENSLLDITSTVEVDEDGNWDALLDSVGRDVLLDSVGNGDVLDNNSAVDCQLLSDKLEHDENSDTSEMSNILSLLSGASVDASNSSKTSSVPLHCCKSASGTVSLYKCAPLLHPATGICDFGFSNGISAISA